MDELKKFNIVNIKKLIPNMRHLVPNALLIFSIGMVIILILLSVKFTDLKAISVMSSFYFTLHPCNSYEDFIEKNKKNSACAGIPQPETVINANEKETTAAVMADFKEDYCQKKDLEDLQGIQPLLFVCRAAYLVSSNMSNSIIKGLYNILNLEGVYSIGVLILYLGMFFLLKFLRELINRFIPAFMKGNKKKSSFIFDIIFSIFSIITVVYVVCLIPTILTYLIYLVYGVVFSDSVASTNVVRPMFFIMIVIIPLILWLVGVNLNITEGFRSAAQRRRGSSNKLAKRILSRIATAKAQRSRTSSTRTSTATASTARAAPKKAVKCGDYNWIFFVSLILIIPTMAALKQIPFLIISGINGMFCISKMKTDTTEKVKEKSNLLKKLSFVSAYGIIIFIGMIIAPIIIHMLRNITIHIKVKFLTDLLNQLEDLLKI
jgi:hypothetical protein